MGSSRTHALAATALAGLFVVEAAAPAQAFLFFGRQQEEQPAPAPEPVPEGVLVVIDRLPPPRPAGLPQAGAAAPAPLATAPLAASPAAGPLTLAPGAAAAVPAETTGSPAGLALAPLPPRPPSDLPRGPAPAAIVTASAVPGLAPAAPAQPTAPVAPAAPAPAPAAAAQPVAPTPAVATAPAPAPIQTAARAPASDAEIVQRANAFFNGISAISGRFTQVGSDGGRLTGTLYVHRPGRLRFAYDEPATIDVVADGRSVVVRDRRLSTQDVYPISQTPLKFLLGDRIRLGTDVRVIGVERAGSEVDLLLEDRSTFAGTSRIRLTFDEAIERLKEWRIMDAQGFETRVTLDGLQRAAALDPGLFRIEYDTFRQLRTD